MTLRLGDTAPDFEQDSTIGTLRFHDWAGDSWVVLFSHPADFTPDPHKKVRLTITYPMSTGRNFDEVLRVIDALQLTDGYSVATPGNWRDGDDVIIPLTIQDPEVIKQKFPKAYSAARPYLRVTPQPNK
ncbi:MAG TPA: hypothetical protein VFG03_09825 [Telluria sp.]|nr:hypothetical protein [Telluria sp.]